MSFSCVSPFSDQQSFPSVISDRVSFVFIDSLLEIFREQGPNIRGRFLLFSRGGLKSVKVQQTGWRHWFSLSAGVDDITVCPT